MSDWRNDPATEAQKRRMLEDGLKYSENITKGEASDLIGSLLKPEDEQIVILKFFKIRGISEMSQTDANKKIEELFSNEDNKSKWSNRPASKEQKEIYNYFKIPFSTDLSCKEAEKFIDTLFEDETRQDAWENRQDEIEELENWFEDCFEIINGDNYYYDCKKMSKKLFRQTVAELESTGYSKSDIETNSELVFKKAMQIDPSIKKTSQSKKQNISSISFNTTKNKGCSLLLFIILFSSTLVYYLLL